MKVRVKARPLSRALRNPELLKSGTIDPDVRKSGCSIVTVLHNPDDNLIYCGLTTATNDLLWTYNPADREWNSLGYQKIAEKYEVKIHRSLVRDDGVIYGATACLHGDIERLNAPGGKLFKFDPSTKRYEVLAIPVPHEYIQTIGMDHKRKVIYGDTYPLGLFWSYDLNSKVIEDLGRANLGAGLFCDREGNAWGTIGEQHLLFRYNPDDRFTIFDFSLPNFMGRPDGLSDCFQPSDEQVIYIGCQSGAIFSLDLESVHFDYLGHPLPASRIHGLVLAKDGLIYGAGGGKGEAENEIFAYDREAKKFYNCGPIYDPDEDCYNRVAHCITITDDGTIFTGETDHPKRAGYLWECNIER